MAKPKAKKKARKKPKATKKKARNLTPKQAVAMITRQSEIIIREFLKVQKEEIRDFKAVSVEHAKNLKIIRDLIADTKKSKVSKIAKLRKLIRQGKDVNLDKL
jgi:hypothetical protein